MKYFSLFSGVGGFEIGITSAYANNGDVLQSEGTKDIPTLQPIYKGGKTRATCLGFSELDRYASDVLRFHYPETKNYGDITKIDWSTVPGFDLLVGGSPCQSFSIAGKRAGFNGASGLFWEYLRCLKEKKPEHFIWENVKGVLSSNHGYDFANIVDSFSEAGYALWWQVLNAKDFGVPQNRERVFVVGTRTGSPREIFFETGCAGQDTRRVGEEIAYTIDASYHKGTNTTEKSRRQVVRIEQRAETGEQGVRQNGLESDSTDSRGGADTYPKS